MQAIEQQLLIREDRIITPLTEVLNTVNPNSFPKPTEAISPTLVQSLDEMFPEQQVEEKTIQETKKILGATADKLTKEQLKDVITETRFLVETWLDDFERDIFGGVTLNELLHEKGKL